MKKLYRKGTVHPSPPIISDHLSFLPAAILTLAAALSPEDREVLAYLISCSNSSVSLSSGPRRRTTHKAGHGKSSYEGGNYSRNNSTGGADHPPLFNCDCFRCYMSYWVRWDSSPNRQLIHEIIDSFEDGLMKKNKSVKNSRKERRKRGGCNNGSVELEKTELMSSRKNELRKSELVIESTSGNNIGGCEGGCDCEEETEKGSVRRFVSFIGERIWGVWGQ